jgi:hypothetical protein
MKRAAHAFRYDTDTEPKPGPRVLPVVVAVDRRSTSIADDAAKSQLTQDQERFSIVMWDEV